MLRTSHLRTCATVMVLLVLSAGVSGPRTSELTRTDRAYVVLLEHVDDAEAMAHTWGLSPKLVFDRGFKGFSATLTPEDVAQISTLSGVSLYLDQPFSLASHSVHSGSTPNDLWNLMRAGGPALVQGTACVIDTGVDLDHPDLNVSVQWSRSLIESGPESDDPNDRNGHGTHIAGIIAALADEAGVTGVASGATIVGIKVVDRQGTGYTSDVLAGIEYAAGIQNQDGSPVCDVVNLSMGAARDSAVDKAVRKASKIVPFVISAGNQGAHVNSFSPARVNAKRVYTVTAIAEGDRWPLFSNFGAETIDYAAPGVYVRSTWKNGGYKTISGTSAAAAHVSGMFLRGGPVPDGIIVDPAGGRYVIPVAPPAPPAPLLAVNQTPEG